MKVNKTTSVEEYKIVSSFHTLRKTLQDLEDRTESAQLDAFKARFPRRFYNCGVAEANMMSVAAGLAMAGMRPAICACRARPLERTIR
jgi:transketolase C-terminal domain/subunit